MMEIVHRLVKNCAHIHCLLDAVQRLNALDYFIEMDMNKHECTTFSRSVVCEAL